MAERGEAIHDLEAVRAIEHAATKREGFPSLTLMERAAAAAWRCLRELWPAARRLVVVCGTGNNAGDGYGLALLARAEGREVRVLQVGTPAICGDAAVMWARLREASVPVEQEFAVLTDVDLIVDAVFGIGLNRPVAGDARGVIEAMNAARAPCFSLDIPSGLDGGTGVVQGVAVRAAATLSFIALKPGLVTGSARDHTGQLRVDSLGLDVASLGQPAFARQQHWAAWRDVIRPRTRCAHKGESGHVLVIGGAPGYAGAVHLAAEAALRTGAGLVSVAVAPAVTHQVGAGRPEIMVHGVSDAADLTPLLARASVVAVGPGLGQSTWSLGLWSALSDVALPQVVDADALNLLARDPHVGAQRILTPHPGEAARLLGPDAAGLVQRDRYAAAAALRARYGGQVVLKGAGTVVNTSTGCHVIAGGNPGMAVGGMGDVLSGILAALLAIGLSPEEAAVAGPALHAAAGDRAARDGERGMSASEVIQALRGLVN